MKHVLGTILIAGLLLHCSYDETPDSQPPETLINEELYIQMLAELQLYNAWVSMSDTLYKPDSLQSAVYQKFDVSPEVFKESHRYYSSDFKAQNVRIDSALKILDREKIRINKAQSVTHLE
ncbi:MAG TPA: hypothetical protein DEQ34_01070 [Balneolaceae bacterium]|nr:hypothetical protein [Balneolaceae bacterium]